MAEEAQRNGSPVEDEINADDGPITDQDMQGYRLAGDEAMAGTRDQEIIDAHRASRGPLQLQVAANRLAAMTDALRNDHTAAELRSGMFIDSHLTRMLPATAAIALGGNRDLIGDYTAPPQPPTRPNINAANYSVPIGILNSTVERRARGSQALLQPQHGTGANVSGASYKIVDAATGKTRNIDDISLYGAAATAGQRDALVGPEVARFRADTAESLAGYRREMRMYRIARRRCEFHIVYNELIGGNYDIFSAGFNPAVHLPMLREYVRIENERERLPGTEVTHLPASYAGRPQTATIDPGPANAFWTNRSIAVRIDRMDPPQASTLQELQFLVTHGAALPEVFSRAQEQRGVVSRIPRLLERVLEDRQLDIRPGLGAYEAAFGGNPDRAATIAAYREAEWMHTAAQLQLLVDNVPRKGTKDPIPDLPQVGGLLPADQTALRNHANAIRISTDSPEVVHGTNGTAVPPTIQPTQGTSAILPQSISPIRISSSPEPTRVDKGNRKAVSQGSPVSRAGNATRTPQNHDMDLNLVTRHLLRMIGWPLDRSDYNDMRRLSDILRYPRQDDNEALALLNALQRRRDRPDYASLPDIQTTPEPQDTEDSQPPKRLRLTMGGTNTAGRQVTKVTPLDEAGPDTVQPPDWPSFMIPQSVRRRGPPIAAPQTANPQARQRTPVRQQPGPVAPLGVDNGVALMYPRRRTAAQIDVMREITASRYQGSDWIDQALRLQNEFGVHPNDRFERAVLRTLGVPATRQIATGMRVASRYIRTGNHDQYVRLMPALRWHQVRQGAVIPQQEETGLVDYSDED